MNNLMACGHSANGVDSEGKPVCAICVGLTPKAKEIATTPDLAGRLATCAYRCGSKEPSKVSLPFFQHRPDKPTDEYYCGCFGWD